MFSCLKDQALLADMAARQETYSPVCIRHVDAFRMARYVMITPNPEDDVNRYMSAWAVRSGLTDFSGRQPTMIGWDFPFVSDEQRRFGLRGYAAACVQPAGFEPGCCGAEMASQGAADYAVITIRDPFTKAFDRIPQAYQLVMKWLEEQGHSFHEKEGVLACFEYVYQQDETDYMDVYVLADGVTAE